MPTLTDNFDGVPGSSGEVPHRPRSSGPPVADAEPKSLDAIFDLARNARRRLAPEFVYNLYVEACAALLKMARARSLCEGMLVHGRLSPQCMVVRGDGRLEIAGASSEKNPHWAKSTTEALVGSKNVEAGSEIPHCAGYLAPEQILGKPGDARADVFSLALCMAELLSAKRLADPVRITSGQVAADLVASLRGAPRPAREVARALVKSLVRERDRRYPGLNALVTDLGRIGTQLGFRVGPRVTAAYLRRLVSERPVSTLPPGPVTLNPGVDTAPAESPRVAMKAEPPPLVDNSPAPGNGVSRTVMVRTGAPVVRHRRNHRSQSASSPHAQMLPPPPVDPGEGFPDPLSDAPTLVRATDAPESFRAISPPRFASERLTASVPPMFADEVDADSDRTMLADEVDADLDPTMLADEVDLPIFTAAAGSVPPPIFAAGAGSVPPPVFAASAASVPPLTAATATPPRPMFATDAGSVQRSYPPRPSALPILSETTQPAIAIPRESEPPGVGRTVPPSGLGWPRSQPAIHGRRSILAKYRALPIGWQIGVAAALVLLGILPLLGSGKGKLFVAVSGNMGQKLAGVAISVDGSEECSGDRCSFDLPPGMHELAVRADGYVSQSQVVVVRSKDPVAANVRLEKAIGTIKARALPDRTTLIVDGKSAGQLPLELDLPSGRHVLRFEARNHAPEERTIELAVAQTRIIDDVVLRPVIGRATFDVRTPGVDLCLVADNERWNHVEVSRPVNLDLSKKWVLEARKGSVVVREPLVWDGQTEQTFVVTLERRGGAGAPRSTSIATSLPRAERETTDSTAAPEARIQ